jgi:hypothetical protein
MVGFLRFFCFLKRCVSLISSGCSSTTSKISDSVVTFVSAQQKFRGLRVINLSTEKIVCRGYLYKVVLKFFRGR